MPTIFEEDKIRYKMYYLSSDHNPPHIHVIYNDHEACLDIEKCELTEGVLPNKVMRKARKFVSDNQELLLDMWIKQDFTSLKKGAKNGKTKKI